MGLIWQDALPGIGACSLCTFFISVTLITLAALESSASRLLCFHVICLLSYMHSYNSMRRCSSPALGNCMEGAEPWSSACYNSDSVQLWICLNCQPQRKSVHDHQRSTIKRQSLEDFSGLKNFLGRW